MDPDVTAWLIELTDFGDLAVLVPLSAAIQIWLLRNSSRAAPRWILALSLCIWLTALLKITFQSCPFADNIHSPGGHTSLSTLWRSNIGVRDCLAAAASRPGDRRRRRDDFDDRDFTSVAQHPQRDRSRPGVGHRHSFAGNVQSAISTRPDYEDLAAASRCRRIGLGTPRPRIARRTLPSPDYRLSSGPLRLIPIM